MSVLKTRFVLEAVSKGPIPANMCQPNETGKYQQLPRTSRTDDQQYRGSDQAVAKVLNIGPSLGIFEIAEHKNIDREQHHDK